MRRFPVIADRIVYFKATVLILGEPTGASTWYGHATRQCPIAMQNWNLYRRCCFRALWYEDRGYLHLNRSTEAKNERFDTFEQLMQWCQANTKQESGSWVETCVIELFDMVDRTLPGVSKLYGINRAYATFKGHGQYRGSRPHLQETYCRWGQWRRWFQEAYTHIFGRSCREPIPEGALWFPTNWRKVYGDLKAPNSANQLVIQGARCFYDLARDNWTDALNEGGWPGFPLEPTVCWFDSWMSSWGFLPWGSPYNRRNVWDGSALLVYPVVDNMDPGSRRFQSLYVRPLGVDQVNVDLIDLDRYALEVVEVQRYDREPRILRTLDISMLDADNFPSRMSLGKNMLSLSKSLWIPTFGQGLPQLFNGGFHRMGDIRFRVRDLSTNTVSPLSTAKVVQETGHPHKLVQFLVK